MMDQDMTGVSATPAPQTDAPAQTPQEESVDMLATIARQLSALAIDLLAERAKS